VYWCALGPPARTFRRGLGIATLQPVSSPAVGFTTNPLLGLWESTVAQVLNRQSAATQRLSYVQAAAVGRSLSTRAVAASEPDVLVTHLAIPRVAGRCTCVLWAASNITLVRHDGRVR